MLSASIAARKAVWRNSKMLVRATLTLADGTVHELSGDDFMMGTTVFKDSVSSDGSFDVGAAIVNGCDLVLNNLDERFSSYDFTGAKVVPYVGIPLPDGGTEWLRKGVYNVEQPSSYGATVKLECLDNMALLERPYDRDWPTATKSLRTVLSEICSDCDVLLDNPSFANSTATVAGFSNDGTLTCRDMVSYVAQASGNFARFDQWGNLRIGWYDTSAFEGADWLDGGILDDGSPRYSSGDAADGGSFAWPSGDTLDGGAFDMRDFAVISNTSSRTLATDDVVVTGVRVKASDEEGDGSELRDGEAALYGKEGYVLSIEGNPLVKFGKASEAAARIGARVVGMRFRPFDASCIGDPTVEAGDPVVVVDSLGREYRSFVTSYTYKAGAYASAACSAETPRRNSAGGASAATKAYVAARNAVKVERTEREKAVGDLNAKLAEGTGLYSTTKTMSDGSKVYYLHDRPTLAESKTVWEMNANGLGISSDGGKTYTVGLDVSGNAILNKVYAIGIDADYVTAGALTVMKGSRKVFEADVDTGGLYIDARKGDARVMYVNTDTGEVEINASKVLVNTRKAFADDKSAVTINGGVVTFNSNTFVVNSTNFSVTANGSITAKAGTIGGFSINTTSIYSSDITLNANGLYTDLMTLDKNGLYVKSEDGLSIGWIGRNGLDGYPDWYGLLFNLAYDDGWYMGWACEKVKGQRPKLVLSYSNATGNPNMPKDSIVLGAGIDGHNFEAAKLWLDPDSGGASGGVTITTEYFDLPHGVADDGTPDGYYANCWLQFKHGFLVGGALPRYS